MPTSDDFSSGSLGSVWSLEGPGGSVSLGVDGGEAYAELVVPSGDFDPWKENKSVRLMQATTDGDISVEAGFLSTPSERYQMQGILVEQDADNWIRFDTYSAGNRHYIFAATTENGVSRGKINLEITSGDAQYLQVERSGDTWTFNYSSDGQVWTAAGSFDHALTVNAVGPFGGATAGAGGFTAQVDYFFDSNAPIVDEDGTIVPPSNTPPVAVDDAGSTDADTPLVLSIAGLLANDTDADGDTLSLTGFDQPTNGALVDNGDGTLTYTPNIGYTGADSFAYTVSDGNDTATATVNLNINDPAANTPPVAVDDAGSTDADTPLVLSIAGLLANDTDADGDTLSLTGFDQPTNGALVDNGDGTLTYTPNIGYTGADSFAYTVSDGNDTATATVNLNINDPAANTPPVAVDDAGSTDADTPLVLSIAGLFGQRH